MQCPHCATELRLMEDVPAALLDTHVRLSCPVARCAKDIVSTVRWCDGFVIVPLDNAGARRLALRQVARAQRGDLVFPAAATVGVFALTILLAIWQLLVPSAPPADNTRSLLIILAGGFGTMLPFAGAVTVDLWLGTRAWHRTLARPLLNFLPVPQTYR